MSLSKEDIEVFNKALIDEDLDSIIDRLTRVSFSSSIVKAYSFIRLLEDISPPPSILEEWVKILKPSDEDLDKYRKDGIERHRDKNEVDTSISIETILNIIDNRDIDFINKLIYLLLITGRRQSEILFSDYCILKDPPGIGIVLAKSRIKNDDTKFRILHILGANSLTDINDIVNRIEDIRNTNTYETTKGLNKSLGRRVSSLGLRKPHQLRALYVALIEKFHLKGKVSKSIIIKDYLGHKTGQSEFYDYVKIPLIKTNPFMIKSIDKKINEYKKSKTSNANLKIILKDLGFKGGVSKMNKTQLFKNIRMVMVG